MGLIDRIDATPDILEAKSLHKRGLILIGLYPLQRKRVRI